MNTEQYSPSKWITAVHTDFPNQIVIVEELGNDRVLAVIDEVDETDLANAKLIASAPELLEALKDVLASHSIMMKENRSPVELLEIAATLKRVERVISKATQ